MAPVGVTSVTSVTTSAKDIMVMTPAYNFAYLGRPEFKFVKRAGGPEFESRRRYSFNKFIEASYISFPKGRYVTHPSAQLVTPIGTSLIDPVLTRVTSFTSVTTSAKDIIVLYL